MRWRWIEWIVVMVMALCCCAQAQWVQSRAYGGGSIVTMTSLGTFVYAGGTEGIFGTINNGVSWNETDSILAGGALPRLRGTVSDLTTSNGLLFAAGDVSYEPNGVFLSSDDGGIWIQKERGSDFGYPLCLVVNSPIVYAGTADGNIFRSTDNGFSFSEADGGLTNGSGAPIYFLLSMGSQGPEIFAGMKEEGVFRSSDNGTTWTAADSGLGANPVLLPSVTCLLSVDSTLYAGTADQGMFISTNMGARWKAIDSGLSSRGILCLANAGENVFAGTNDGGVFLSLNGGKSWISEHSGLDDDTVVSLTSNGEILFAGTTSDGIWERPLGEMIEGVRAPRASLPSHFRLYQNYPNPFNPATEIGYDLAERSHVSLIVINMLGQQLVTLIDGEQTQGHKTVRFDGTNFSSGVYFYRMTAGTFRDVKRMEIVK